ncbi:hypothetical protein Tco_1125844 [Tanacetum coccineum]
MYVSGPVDIFDMIDIVLFTAVSLNTMILKLGYIGKSEPMFYNYLKPLTSLDEGLYALAYEKDAPRFRATIEEITDEPGSIAANRTEKMLLLTWHGSSETTKEHVCDSVTPNSLPQHDSSTPCKDSVCGNNVEASGSASKQSQQIEPAVGQDGSGGSGDGAVIGFSAAIGEGGAGGPGGAGIASQGSSYSRWKREEYKQKELVHKKELPLNLQVNLLPVLKSQ